MKKCLIAIIMVSMLILPVSGALNILPEYKNDVKTQINIPNEDFTHTTFAEESVATWCPNCPYAAEALYSIYQSDDYPFYYVSLVFDENPIVVERTSDFFINLYKVFAFPTVYFDGGDISMGRDSTLETTETEYRRIIEEIGVRDVRQPVDLDTSVIWLEDAKIAVTVNITNHGNFFYFGKIRSYVTEIESRWKDTGGNPFHFGFLDFAIDTPILLSPGEIETISVTWDGAIDHSGQTFEDITEDNIMVISTVSHWIPHYRTGYYIEDYSFTQRYLAYYVDQTSAATPNTD